MSLKSLLCGKSQQAFFIVYLSKQLKSIKMASIKLGAIVADIKGKLAGNYFAKRKNTTVLAVCGSKLTKADAGRTSLQLSRNNMAKVSRAWSDLLAARKLVWENQAALLTWYTKVGIPYTPSGYQFFSQNNLNRSKLRLPLLTNYHEPSAPADIARVQVEISAGGVIEYSYAGSLSGGKYVVISASAPNSTGVKYAKGGYKIISIQGPDEVGPVVITSEYISVFGAAPLSGMVFFKTEIIDGDSGIAEGSKLTKADAGLV